MAALLQQGFLSIRGSPRGCCHLSPPSLRFESPPSPPPSGGRRSISGPGIRLLSAPPSRISPLAASREDSKTSSFDAEKDKKERDLRTTDLEEAWLRALESFRDEAVRMRGISQEAYDIYSKKAAIILNETSEKLRYHAVNARDDFSFIAEEINEGGKQFVSSSPDVKETLEAISSIGTEPKGLSALRDFHIGLIYGISLAVGGFLSFMITGETAGIRFGVIIGSILTYSSLSSYRSWKSRGTSSNLYTQAESPWTSLARSDKVSKNRTSGEHKAVTHKMELQDKLKLFSEIFVKTPESS